MKKVVTVGGGTGSYVVLSGLKNLPGISLSALVTMADDGGSTGVLRRKWGVMPPGDARQCLVALSGKEFLNHRITHGFMKGHKLGNIFLAALEKLTGDFARGLKIISWIFKTKGKIIPVTKDTAELGVLFQNGKKIWGENNIDMETFSAPVQDIFYKDNVKINPEAGEAISRADYIIIGPGNVFCSLIPNLIVSGFNKSINQTKAKIIFIMNLVNKAGHTMGWRTTDYVNIVEKYLGKKVDVILINEEEFSKEQKELYLADGKEREEKIFIRENLEDPRIIRANLLSKKVLMQNDGDPVKRSLIRHDPEKLANCIKNIIQ